MSDVLDPTRHPKKYPHFDSISSYKKLSNFVNDPNNVSKHSFHPFIKNASQFIPFRGPEGLLPEPKIRPIVYASRRDSAIFSKYRGILALELESEISRLRVSESVLAYRKIPRANTDKNKSNIDFACDCFSEIRLRSNCIAVALDLSKFFDTIDHRQLLSAWTRLLGKKHLPENHLKVFKAVTQFSTVSLDPLLIRLSEFSSSWTHKQRSAARSPYKRHLLPIQLCNPTEFRELVAGTSQSVHESLIEKKSTAYGIPQGSPMSDVLANLALLRFDKKAQAYASAQGGSYRRYSDDLLFLLPGGMSEGAAATQFCFDEISQHGSTLRLNTAKTNYVAFKNGRSSETKRYRLDINGDSTSIDLADFGLEYLGFRFDGNKVRLRDKTVSSFARKVRFLTKIEVHRQAAANRGKSSDWLHENFNHNFIEEKIGRTQRRENRSRSTRTFHSYMLDANRRFASVGIRFEHHLPYREWVNNTLNKWIPLVT